MMPMEGLVVWRPFLFVQEIQVEIHFAGVLRLEGAELEIEGDKGLEHAVIKEKVHEIFLSPEDQSVLPADEAEAVTQFQDELLQSFDEPVLQLALLHGAADAEKFKVIAALHHLVRLLRKMLRQRERRNCGSFSPLRRARKPRL